jgi:4-hydroxy-tetrahydrodipicolinate reductase
VIDIAICGIRGRMGQALVELAAGADVRIIGGTSRTGGETAFGTMARIMPLTEPEAGDLLRSADVVIDVSSADGTRTLLEHHADALAGRALIVGTTGLDQNTASAIDRLADRTAVLVAANFSIGVNLLLAVAERMAAVLDAAHFDVEIVELHHRGKADAPSGTALALGAAVARGRAADLEHVRQDGRSGQTGPRPEGVIGMHAVRGGSVIGEHRLLFIGDRERIELVHAATDRAAFADGALRAARWIAGRAPGRYTMLDVLDTETN